MNPYSTVILILVFFAAFEMDRHRSFSPVCTMPRMSRPAFAQD